MGNKLKGGIPKKLSKHKALKNPNLNENRHGGVMPPGRGGLNALEELNLGWIICKVDLLVVVGVESETVVSLLQSRIVCFLLTPPNNAELDGAGNKKKK